MQNLRPRSFFFNVPFLFMFVLGVWVSPVRSSENSGLIVLKNGFWFNGSAAPIKTVPEENPPRDVDGNGNWEPYKGGEISRQPHKNTGEVKEYWLRYPIPKDAARDKSYYLSLSSVHDVESVYVNQKLLYYKNLGSAKEGLDQGLTDWWLLLPLPPVSYRDTGDYIYLKLVSEGKAGVFDKIVMGDYKKLIHGELASDLVYFSFSVSLALIGLLFIVLLTLSRRFFSSDFWLGWLILVSGGITLTWSRTFYILLNFSENLQLFRIICMTILPFIFVLFFQTISWTKSRFLNRWLIFLLPIPLVSVIFLKIGVMNIYQYTYVLMVLFSSSLGVILFTAFAEIRKFNLEKKPGLKKFLPDEINLILIMEVGIAMVTGIHDILIIQNVIPEAYGLMPIGLFVMLILTAFYMQENFKKKSTDYQETIRSLREKSLSLAGMSHEIRIPLTGIIGMGNLLSETMLSDEQRWYLNTIRSSSSSLLNQINDILDFVKIDAAQMHFLKEPINITDTIENTIQMLSTRAAEQRNELFFILEPDLPEYVLGDSARIGQILTNLVGNAVKFTRDGDIELRVLQKRSHGRDWIEFRIRDTGIGIEPDRIEDLFNPFVQADSSISKKYGGTGLGLYISKKLAELMNGSLGVESEPGKGSTFIFRLPLEVAEEDHRRKTRGRTLKKSRKILILGEHPGVTVMIEQMCARNGYKPLVMSITTIHHTIPPFVPGSDQPWDLIILVFDEFSFEKFYLKKIHKDSLSPVFVLLPLNLKKEYLDILQESRISHYAGFLTTAQLEEKIESFFTAKARKTGIEKRDKFAEEYPQSILVVDDNPVNRIVVEKMLNHLGYVPDFATTGNEAVDKAISNIYDLIFMDIQMPEKDGVTVSKEILSFWDSELSPRIIAMTSDALREDRGRFADAGLVDCVLKPPSIENLQRTIKKHASIKVKNVGAA